MAIKQKYNNLLNIHSDLESEYMKLENDYDDLNANYHDLYNINLKHKQDLKNFKIKSQEEISKLIDINERGSKEYKVLDRKSVV